VELSTQTMKLELGVEWVHSGAICAECGKKCTRHDLAPERRWRHLDAMGFETQIVSRTPRANCAEHGIHQMKVPWAGKHSRFTLAFEALAIKVMLASRSIKAACELLKINWEGAQAIMERAVKRGKERRVLDNIKAVGLDEKSFHRGQSYVSVLVDLEPGAPRILDVCNGRKKEDAIQLLEKLPEPARAGVEAVAMDMSTAYQGAAQAVLPKADVVFDRFHISKLMGEAMDQDRREEHKKLLSKGDKRLVGTRYASIPMSFTNGRRRPPATGCLRGLHSPGYGPRVRTTTGCFSSNFGNSPTLSPRRSFSPSGITRQSGAGSSQSSESLKPSRTICTGC